MMQERFGSTPLIATATYCAASLTMMFANKAVLSVYKFDYQLALIAFQCLVSVIILQSLRVSRLLTIESLKLSVATKWFPVTVLFVGMIFTGSKSLALLSIPVVTVFKNLTNILIAYGDKYLYNQKLSNGVLASLVCMVVGSIFTGYTDLAFNLEGYAWMLVNCACTASYTLYLRRAKGTTKLSEFGMGLYNNALACTMLIPAGLLTGEFRAALGFEQVADSNFLGAMIFASIVGTGIGLSAFWLINVTSPTTFSIVGSLNKVPLVIFSAVLFNVPMSFANTMSVMFGIASGMMFTYAKYQEQQAQNTVLPSRRL